MSGEQPETTELTGAEAADILNVSVGYLNGLLDKGEIAHRQDGEHRFVNHAALLEYKRKTSELRQRALQELVELSEELGLYDDPPPR